VQATTSLQLTEEMQMQKQPEKYASTSRQRGYNLIELLTAMAVLAILTTVAVPGMRNIMLDNRRVSATNEFVYTMQLARSEAISRNQRVTVCPSVNGRSCANRNYWSRGWIMFNDIDLNRVPGGTNETIMKYVEVNGDFDVAPIRFTGTYTYRPNGRIMGTTTAVQNGEFVFCDQRGDDYARVVVVESNGRPQLSKYRADGSDVGCS
jgi:type IV fimbrial biogenesis protein FimT